MQKSSFLAAVAASALLASCSGSLGGGGTSGGIGGLSGPVAPNVAQPYAAPTPLDRERSLEDSIAFLPSATSLTLPPVSGFAIAIDLSPPTPAPPGGAVTAPASGAPGAMPLHPDSHAHGNIPPAPPLPVPSAAATVAFTGTTGVVFRSSHFDRALAVTGIFVAQASPAAMSSDSASSAPAGSATAGADGTATAGPATDAGSASPAAAPSGSASGVASPAVATTPAPRGSSRPVARPTHRPTPKPSPSGPVVEFKETVYPDFAEKPPDPKIKSPVARVALVRGYLKMPADVTLASLAAVKFTIPAGEVTPGRGFTIALYDERRKKRPHLIVADTAAVVSDKTTVSGVSDDIVELDHGNPYSFVLFADALPPSPPPAGTYPNATTQFNQPGPGQPGAPGQSTLPGQVPCPGQTPLPLATPFPGSSPYPLASCAGQQAYPPAGYNQPYGTPTLSATLPPNYPTFPPQ